MGQIYEDKHYGVCRIGVVSKGGGIERHPKRIASPHVVWGTSTLQLQVKGILIFSIMDYLYLKVETDISIPGDIVRPP